MYCRTSSPACLSLGSTFAHQPPTATSNQKVIKTYVHTSTSTLLNNIIGDEPRTPTTDGQRNKHSACCNGSNLGTSDESNAGTTATKFRKTKVYLDVVRNKFV